MTVRSIYWDMKNYARLTMVDINQSILHLKGKRLNGQYKLAEYKV